MILWAANDAKAKRERDATTMAKRKRTVALLPPQVLDQIIRAEAHFDRRFNKTLNQLELLQRMRSGDRVPAPVRIEVTEDGPERWPWPPTWGTASANVRLVRPDHQPEG